VSSRAGLHLFPVHRRLSIDEADGAEQGKPMKAAS
jgi:hypothetical protein